MIDQVRQQVKQKSPRLRAWKDNGMENKKYVKDNTGKLRIPPQEERHAPSFKKAPKKD